MKTERTMELREIKPGDLADSMEIVVTMTCSKCNFERSFSYRLPFRHATMQGKVTTEEKTKVAMMLRDFAMDGVGVFEDGITIDALEVQQAVSYNFHDVGWRMTDPNDTHSPSQPVCGNCVIKGDKK